MKKQILSLLSDLENQYSIKILLAVESGSRAWGFPSRDSDYDVRLIYIHEPRWYLSVVPGRDVIELMQDELLDFSGWDLPKTLMLFRKFNPPLMEWLDSEIIYREFSSVPQKLRDMKEEYFSPKPCIHHYLHMAEGNFRHYLQGGEVKLKKYFYAIRPVLACIWIEKKKTHPPILFRDLLDFCAKDYPEVCGQIEILLWKKQKGDELDLGPKIEILNEFIAEKISHFNEYIQSADKHKILSEEKMNKFFINSLKEIYGDKY